MTLSFRPSGPHEDGPDSSGVAVETGLPDLGCVDLGDIDCLDGMLLANARRAVLASIESPDLAVARFDPGRDAHETTCGPSRESVHTRADGNAAD